jgi:DeoR/GlpR family transcriptional regulator of sugar metabolism
MTRYTRKEEIITHIKEKRVCAVEELQEKFAVSLSTIHRDLNLLEREGRINKYYGKVTLKEEKDFFHSRIKVNVELKRKMAKKALEFVENSDCIFLDNSTTVYYLAESLCTSFFKDVLVVSNSALTMELFLKNKYIDFVSTGGKLDKDFYCFVGPQALKALDDFNGNKFFFSTLSISPEGGISDIYFPDEISIKNKMHEKAQKSFLLVDSTKFGKVSTIKWFELRDVGHIITDSGISEEHLQRFRDMEIDIIVA